MSSSSQNLAATLASALALVIAAPATETSAPQVIDLPTALRLAGAQNLDVQVARERLAEAKALHSGALAQFFPWLSPGIAFRQHDGKIQDVGGKIIDVDKYSYAPGASVAVRLELGDALYKSLAAKQIVNAAGHALEAQRQDTVLAAAQGYFDLALGQASVGVADESVRISADYATQLKEAVGAGLAFKGDWLRATVEQQRNQLALRQTLEQLRLAATRLSKTLHLDPAVELVAQTGDLAPLSLIETNAALSPLVQQALLSRPELKQSQSFILAARKDRQGASYGPLIPSLGAEAFFGGLGGGVRGTPDTFGGQQDYLVGLSWRVGPGGVFDFTRAHATDARLKVAELSQEKLRDDLVGQVVDAFTRWQSLGDQLGSAAQALAAAEEGLSLAKQRKEFAVGIVLETIQAEQDLTRARLDYLRIIAQFNQAQYLLSKAIGKL